MKLLRRLVLILWAVLAGGATADVEDNPFVGTWSHEANESCTELHIFNTDGSLLVRSNDQLVTRSYKIISADRESNIYKLQIEELRDNGEVDCFGDSYDYVGARYIVYAVFDDSYQRFYFHFEKDLTDSAIGPYSKGY